MAEGPEPRFLPHTTPTALAEGRYAAAPRRQRAMGPGGVPKPGQIYLKTESALLQAIAKQAWVDFLAAMVPTDWEGRVVTMFVAELDRLYPPADMAVLERYDAHKLGRSIVVSVDRRLHELPLTPPRPLPRNVVMVGGQIQFFRDGVPPRAVPAAAEPYFAALQAAHSDKYEQFDRCPIWAGAETSRKRPPTWAQIEEKFPRVGAWIQQKRGS